MRCEIAERRFPTLIFIEQFSHPLTENIFDIFDYTSTFKKSLLNFFKIAHSFM